MIQLGLEAPRGVVNFHRGRWEEMRLPERFVLIGDPPYGQGYESNYHLGSDRKDTGNARTLATGIGRDRDTSQRDAFMERGGWVAAAVYGPDDALTLKVPAWTKRDAVGAVVIEPRHMLVVDKGEGAGGLGDLSFPWKSNYETIAIYGDGWAGRRTSSVLQSRVVAFGRESAANGRRHPNEKDLRNVVELVSKAPRGLAVVDPWGGSGTTAEACALLGRVCFTAEIDPQYWPTIEARATAHGAQMYAAGTL